ncbi:hypothetical protein QBC46DRAFT_274888, partial [Diplogelasinospora grovesii]
LEFRMDKDSKNLDYVAVVVDFDRSDGVIIIEGIWLTAGKERTVDGKRLYITSDAVVFGEEKPDVYYIRRE